MKNLVAAVLYRIRKVFWWQLTISQVNFITEDGVERVLHVHPAWWGRQRVYEDALYEHLPNMIGEVEE